MCIAHCIVMCSTTRARRRARRVPLACSGQSAKGTSLQFLEARAASRALSMRPACARRAPGVRPACVQVGRCRSSVLIPPKLRRRQEKLLATLLGQGRPRTEKPKPRIWGNSTQKPRIKKIFLEHILRPIQKPISSLPDHFGIGVKMTSKNIFFFTLGFWVELPQILGLGFSVRHTLGFSDLLI